MLGCVPGARIQTLGVRSRHFHTQRIKKEGVTFLLNFCLRAPCIFRIYGLGYGLGALVRGNVEGLPPSASVSDVSLSECPSISREGRKPDKLLCTSTGPHAAVTTCSHLYPKTGTDTATEMPYPQDPDHMRNAFCAQQGIELHKRIVPR